MTEQEAIKRIEEFGTYHVIGDLPHPALTVQAFNMAVSVLVEIQQYKALGTVEELKDKLEQLQIDEAIISLPSDCVLCKEKKELEKYKAIGTMEELQEAMEKQKPKKPILDKFHHHSYYCPKCEEYIWDRLSNTICDRCGYEMPIMPPGHIRPSYCRWCGQVIDWSEMEGNREDD